jgi:hypothetical protein
MSRISDYITVTSGTKDTNYKVSDDRLFFISGTSTIKPSKDCMILYIVVGGGANGNAGSGTSTVGRGGGGGAVQTGRVSLKANTEYKIQVKPTLANGNGDNTVFTENTTGTKLVDITANGGRMNGNSGDGGRTTGGQDNKLVQDASSPSSGSTLGNGGVSPVIEKTGALPGKATNKNGNDGSIGGGGGGGYGSTGRGGNGGPGAVILLDIDNSNLVQHIEKQLREMNHLPGTMVDQYNERYNATMMAGALWTVLATSLAFYVFTQV